MGYDEFGSERIKHLEMIQAVVSRLGTDSFLVKGWAVTLNGALFGFAVSGKNWRLALLGVVASVSLWQLDTYFLRAERLFRRLYEAVRTAVPAVEPFYMSATSEPFQARLRALQPDSGIGWWPVALSRTLLGFYAVLVGLAVVLAAGLYLGVPTK